MDKSPEHNSVEGEKFAVEKPEDFDRMSAEEQLAWFKAKLEHLAVPNEESDPAMLSNADRMVRERALDIKTALVAHIDAWSKFLFEKPGREQRIREIEQELGKLNARVAVLPEGAELTSVTERMTTLQREVWKLEQIKPADLVDSTATLLWLLREA